MSICLHFSIFIPGLASEIFNNIIYYKIYFPKIANNFYITQLQGSQFSSLLAIYLKELY